MDRTSLIESARNAKRDAPDYHSDWPNGFEAMESRMMTKEQLLAEVEDLLRTMPLSFAIHNQTQESLAWLGRLSAVIEGWNPAKAIMLNIYFKESRSAIPSSAAEGKAKIAILLHEARHNLRMRTIGPSSIVVAHGSVFDYFDEIRKLIEEARQDLLFVDPYLDAEFVSRYLVHVKPGVATRLLAREKLPTLIPAVEALAKQSKLNIEIRSAPNFHDRYIFVDKIACYQSGASFKDGAKSAPTTLTQITDAFESMFRTYEELWNRARLER